MLLRQTQSTVADHLSGASRLKYDELLEITELDEAQLAQPVRKTIVIFDDVLTSGKHYRVAKTRILEHLPSQDIVGLFVARAIHANPFDDFDDLDAL
jgi:predicted amidophosphoribosyltransferase